MVRVLYAGPPERRENPPAIPGAMVQWGGDNWRTVITAARKDPTDLILLDAGLLTEAGWPLGAEGNTQSLREVPVLVCGRIVDADRIVSAIGHGARGFVDDGATLSVSAPGTVRNEVDRDQSYAGALKLTERELQVLTGMAAGQSNGEIGKNLFLSEDTVKTHARRIYKKFGARDRAHAVRNGLRLNIIT